MRNHWAAVLGVSLVAATVSAGEGEDHEEIRIKWRFSGSVVSNLARVAPGVPPPVVASATIIHVQALGSPARATLRVSGGGGTALTPPEGFPPPPAPADVCEGLQTFAFLAENSIVATFEDLALLFGARDAEQASFRCTDPATNVSHFVIYLVLSGGTSRFEGAAGRAVITATARPVVPGSAFSYETGTIVGYVRLPDDH